MSPAGLTLLTRTFTGTRRATALAAWGAMSGVAGAAGVLLGGVLTQGPGWQWSFWIDIPVVLVVADGALTLMPRAAATVLGSLDAPGAAVITASVITVYAVVRSGRTVPCPLSSWSAVRSVPCCCWRSWPSSAG